MSTVVFGDYEWDDEKAASNLRKHRVAFEEAAMAMTSDPMALDFADPASPERLVTLAMSPAERILYVVSTERGPRLRIISARVATSHERKVYAEGT